MFFQCVCYRFPSLGKRFEGVQEHQPDLRPFLFRLFACDVLLETLGPENSPCIDINHARNLARGRIGKHSHGQAVLQINQIEFTKNGNGKGWVKRAAEEPHSAICGRPITDAETTTARSTTGP
jgi:hypothetical protein